MDSAAELDGGIARTRSSPSGSVFSRYGPYHNEASTPTQAISKDTIVKQGQLRKTWPASAGEASAQAAARSGVVLWGDLG